VAQRASPATGRRRSPGTLTGRGREDGLRPNCRENKNGPGFLLARMSGRNVARVPGKQMRITLGYRGESVSPMGADTKKAPSSVLASDERLAVRGATLPAHPISCIDGLGVSPEMKSPAPAFADVGQQ
jgi:hypothetical protein